MTILVLLSLLSGLSPAAGRSGGFLRAAASSNTVPGQAPPTVAVKDGLHAALDATLGAGWMAQEKRLRAIEASMLNSYTAMPKNKLGRLDPLAVRNLVTSFFRSERGWIINGLKPIEETNDAGIHDAAVFKALAPSLVEAALKVQEAGFGVSLEEVAALTAALERLILDESVELLQVAFRLNGFLQSDILDETSLSEVLTSYMILHIHRTRVDYDNVTEHQLYKQERKAEGSLEDLDQFTKDAIQNFVFSRPAAAMDNDKRRYSFDAASVIVEYMAHDYGRWQNEDCTHMRDALESMDEKGTGVVPFPNFKAYESSSFFAFTESEDMLRYAGALDESVPARPAVRISNYLLGESNCNPRGNYYMVCCVNPCSGILRDMEGHFKAPLVDPEPLLAMVGNISARGEFDHFRSHGEDLRARLGAIATRHGGKVPLHSRHFEQWMHFAFPRDCPHPLKAVDEAVGDQNFKEQVTTSIRKHRRHEFCSNVANIMVLLAFVAVMMRLMAQGCRRIATLLLKGIKFEDGPHLAAGKFA